MRRESDNNRARRALEHVNAAITHIDSIKRENRTDEEHTFLVAEKSALIAVLKALDGFIKKGIVCVSFLLAMSASGQTIESVKAEIKRQHIPHGEIVLAQARLETGNFKSRRCKVQHNLFGIKHNGKYATYRRWQDSVSDYKKCISSRYKGGDYYAFLRRIGYASDTNYERKLRDF